LDCNQIFKIVIVGGRHAFQVAAPGAYKLEISFSIFLLFYWVVSMHLFSYLRNSLIS